MKNLVKRVICIFSALLLLFSSTEIPRVYANETTMLEMSSQYHMDIDETNLDQVNYYKDASKTILMGSVQVKMVNELSTLTPSKSGSRIVYDTESMGNVSVTVELMPNSTGSYIAPNSYTFGGNLMPLSNVSFTLVLTGGIVNLLSFDFVENNGGSIPGPGPGGDEMPGPMMMYPVIALFEVPGGTSIEVKSDEDGDVTIPENWTSGSVRFEAIIFTKNNGTVEPYNGQDSGGTRSTIDLDIEGIANGEEIYETVNRSVDGQSVTIQEGFSAYGKLQLHLVSKSDSLAQVNQLVRVNHKDLVSITAVCPFSLSQSFGTVALNQAIVTKDEVKDVCIFFGNNETTLIASGPSVDKIIGVSGGANCTLNEDGTATVSLPGLSEATTTTVEVTIKKADGSSITRTVHIVRTAIQLGCLGDGADTEIYAGYVVNKGYLYNNQAHDDAVFDAYLQVILYKDNTVAGYKQIKIDDADLVNRLIADESGSIELYSEKQIAIYGETAGNFSEGVNKVSVFLTNGPIDFNSDKMPSVEFGIGSGVTLQFGGTAND